MAQDSRPLPPGETHRVENVGTELEDINLIATDTPMVEGVVREGGSWGLESLSAFGAKIGRAEYLELGHLANRYPPELDTHDRFGRRIDRVRYHPAYHELMKTAFEHRLHSAPWVDPRDGAHVVRGAMQSMHAQVEQGHGCPVTMTFAAMPTLRLQPSLAAVFEQKVLAAGYDPRNVPAGEKSALTVGMGMTEKQGGSDVRANTTRAVPVASAGAGERYRLTGHKWFLSAPMCDLFLVLAQTGAGVSCFLVPRWLEDGTKNGLQIIRLKEKFANRSNASSEVEFRDAEGWLIGEEGRGVATIIEMVSMTRFDCMGGSAGGMRFGLAQAIHHASRRAAFGKPLVEQPLMRNVLADLALEYEGAIAFFLRMARALDARQSDPQEAALARLAVAVGKYWVCKRGPLHAYEVMECIGGSGVMNNSVFPRLYADAVINPIWEGSGNVQCLDVLRAIGKAPAVMDAFLTEVLLAQGGNSHLDAATAALQRDLLKLAGADADALQFGARAMVDRMALVFQAASLVRHAPDGVSEAFCASRLDARSAGNFGTLPQGSDVDTLIERADPAREVPVIPSSEDRAVFSGGSQAK